MIRDLSYKFLSYFDIFFKFYYKKRLKVLAYHKVPDPELFHKQLQYLEKNYSIISIGVLEDHILNTTPLPRNPLLITFDDGDISVLINGLPLLIKFQFPSCLFIITSLIDTNNEVWIRNLELHEIQRGKTYQEARRKVNTFKNLQNSEREILMKEIQNYQTRQLSTSEIKMMHNNNMYIGNHTHTHPMLDKCSKDEIVNEFSQSRLFFEEAQLPGFSIFAYPNGNNSIDTVNLLKDCGIRLSFLFDHKVNKRQLDASQISRIRVDSDFNLYEFKSKVSGIHSFIFNLKNSL